MAVVIVNYRTAALTVDCLRSLATELSLLHGGRALVLDNASGDSSVQQVATAIKEQGWDHWASILPLERNGGFGYGNNAGIEALFAASNPPAYIYLLNPDAMICPGALRRLVAFMEARPDVGIAGSQLQTPDGEAQLSYHSFPTPWGELQEGARLSLLSRCFARSSPVPQDPNGAIACDWVSGASMLIRRQVFDSVGLFDEGYFLYFEEVDLCARAKAAGWAVFSVPASRVTHIEGASTGIRSTRQRRGKYWYDSRRRFLVKHYGIMGLVVADVLWATGRATRRFREVLGLGGSTDGDPRRFSMDLLWGDLRALLNGSAFRIRSPSAACRAQRPPERKA